MDARTLTTVGVRSTTDTWFENLRRRTHKTLTMSLEPQSLFFTLALLVTLLAASAQCACTSGVIELWAYSNPSTHHFKDSFINKYISTDKGSVCRWKVTASKSNQVVKLTFADFNLKQTHKNSSKANDCVEIFDGASRDAKLVERACVSQPKAHTSSGRHFFVVYHRGDHEGTREFDIVVVAEDVMDKEQIIRIAIIIGGCVAAFVLFYLICRATKCCACIRKKENAEEENVNGYERDCLTGANADPVRNTNASGVPQALGRATAPTAAAAGDGDSVSLPSDTPSLHELNEPPPSYDSLYLNEDGLAPPEYSPPRHHKSHPPRRVHTFN